MKAVICKAWGEPGSLVIEDVPDAVAGPGQVVVEVKSAGVNFPDVLLVQGKYQNRPKLPFIPGGEFASRIKAVG